MRLPGRIAAAGEVLAELAARHRPAAQVLQDWGKAHRFAGAGDRAAIGNIVFDGLRKRRSLAWRAGSDDPVALAMAVVILDWDLNPRPVIDACLNEPHGPGPDACPPILAECLAVGGRPIDGAPDAVRADVPDWLAPRLHAALGDDWIAEASALAARPPVDLRVNTLKAARQAVIGQMVRSHPLALPYPPEALRIAPPVADGRGVNIRVDPAYLRGRVEIQDQGSQIAARLTGARPGEQVLDYCAGGGGKTLALAALMDNHGQIFAYDSDPHRIAPIYERLKRAGVRNTQVIAPAKPGTPSSDVPALAALAGRMDRVLVDAPCTGTGVWRRRPDAKWRLSRDQLKARIAEQGAILSAAGAYVRPGGSLCYVTCSLLEEENERIVAAFLAGHPAFSATDLQAAAQTRLGAGADLPTRAAPYVRITPRSAGTDGFFVAELVRDAGS